MAENCDPCRLWQRHWWNWRIRSRIWWFWMLTCLAPQ